MTGCAVCDLATEVDRLRSEAFMANVKSAKCWMKEEAGQMVVTIYGTISADHRRRLLALLNEVEKSSQPLATPKQ